MNCVSLVLRSQARITIPDEYIAELLTLLSPPAIANTVILARTNTAPNDPPLAARLSLAWLAKFVVDSLSPRQREHISRPPSLDPDLRNFIWKPVLKRPAGRRSPVQKTRTIGAIPPTGNHAADPLGLYGAVSSSAAGVWETFSWPKHADAPEVVGLMLTEAGPYHEDFDSSLYEGVQHCDDIVIVGHSRREVHEKAQAVCLKIYDYWQLEHNAEKTEYPFF